MRRRNLRFHLRLQQDEATRKPDLKLNVPEILKLVLVDDWEAVTKNHQVCCKLSATFVMLTVSLLFFLAV